MNWMDKTTKTVFFIVPGRIRGKARPRSSVRGNHVIVYTPQTTLDAEQVIRGIALEAAQGLRFSGPVSIRIECVFKMPESDRKDGAVRGYCLKKPDGDNVAKLVLDALQGEQGLFEDDAQVAELSVLKMWGSAAEVEDQLLVTVRALSDPAVSDRC